MTTDAGSAEVRLEYPFAGAAPRIFLRDSGSCGRPFIFNVLPDGSWQPNSPTAGAAPGSWIIVLATGAGYTTRIPDGHAAPADPYDRINDPGAMPGRFNRTYAPLNWPHDYSYNGKLAGTVGVDQINLRVPPELAEGCAVPFLLDPGSRHSSQTVPVTISRTPGRCADPPPESSAVIRLERVITSGPIPSGNSSLLTLEFRRAQGRTLLDEGDPGMVHRRRSWQPGGCNVWVPDLIEKLTGPACPGFEAYRGQPLDPGMIVLQHDSGGPEITLAPRQHQDGEWGYSVALPEHLARAGTLRIKGLGSAEVGPFETALEVPPFRMLTDLSPGATLPGTPWDFEWTGGHPGDNLHIGWGSPPLLRTKCIVRVQDGRYQFWPWLPMTGYPPQLKSGDTISEIRFEVEPAEPGRVRFRAAGLTLGGRTEYRLIYRYGGVRVR